MAILIRIFMSRDTRLCTVSLLALLIAAVAPARQTTPRPKPANGQILFSVLVTPKSGPPVGDLHQQDFTLLDNKMSRPIASFRAFSGRQASVEVVVVIDAVNATYQDVSYQRMEVAKFLRADNGRLARPVALVLFTDRGAHFVGNLSVDGNALSALLDKEDSSLRDITRSAGFYGAVERRDLSLTALHQLVAAIAPHPVPKIVIWVSPGWPLLPAADTNLSTKDRQQLFASIVDTSTQLRQARVTLYSVDPQGASESVESASYYQEFLKGITNPEDASFADLGLPVLAIQSGGLAFNSSNDIASTLQKCVADVAPYYEISFTPASARRKDEYHQIEIRLDRPGLTARTRRGYYAEP